jgi:CRP-like cAMP-binding protein
MVAAGLFLPMLILLLSRRLGWIDRTLKPPAARSLLDAVAMFAPLSLAVKDRLASSLVPVPVRAGETVIRAGEEGDRFYLVGSGELAVERGGEVVHSAGPGDSFGEIALIDRVPRTATVRARVDSTLYALDGAPFLAALAGHPLAEAAARRIAAERRPPTGGP